MNEINHVATNLTNNTITLAEEAKKFRKKSSSACQKVTAETV